MDDAAETQADPVVLSRMAPAEYQAPALLLHNYLPLLPFMLRTVRYKFATRRGQVAPMVILQSDSPETVHPVILLQRVIGYLYARVYEDTLAEDRRVLVHLASRKLRAIQRHSIRDCHATREALMLVAAASTEGDDKEARTEGDDE